MSQHQVPFESYRVFSKLCAVLGFVVVFYNTVVVLKLMPSRIRVRRKQRMKWYLYLVHCGLVICHIVSLALGFVLYFLNDNPNPPSQESCNQVGRMAGLFYGSFRCQLYLFLYLRQEGVVGGNESSFNVGNVSSNKTFNCLRKCSKVLLVVVFFVGPLSAMVIHGSLFKVNGRDYCTLVSTFEYHVVSLVTYFFASLGFTILFVVPLREVVSMMKMRTNQDSKTSFRKQQVFDTRKLLERSIQTGIEIASASLIMSTLVNVSLTISARSQGSDFRYNFSLLGGTFAGLDMALMSMLVCRSYGIPLFFCCCGTDDAKATFSNKRTTSKRASSSQVMPRSDALFSSVS